MKEKELKISIGEYSGNINVIELSEGDRAVLKEIYEKWVAVNELLRSIGGRALNVPEGLSESIFCLEMKRQGFGSPVRAVSRGRGWPSGSRVQISFDTIDAETFERQQIKSTSIKNDLTSFGPRSVEDVIYFLDFYKNGSWDGTFDVYKIDENIIKNVIHPLVLNRSQGETFEDQQKQGRRPRFSIREKLINAGKITVLFTGEV